MLRIACNLHTGNIQLREGQSPDQQAKLSQDQLGHPLLVGAQACCLVLESLWAAWLALCSPTLDQCSAIRVAESTTTLQLCLVLDGIRIMQSSAVSCKLYDMKGLGISSDSLGEHFIEVVPQG